jgi:hypothetical protein
MEMLYHHFFQYFFRICHYEGPRKQDKLKLSGIDQLPVYPDDVDLLRDNINVIKKNTEAQIDSSIGVGLEVNKVKSKYMLMSHN